MATANEIYSEIQTEKLTLIKTSVNIANRIQLWCKDQQMPNVHSDMHFAPQLTGDYATEDASCKIP